MNMYAILPLITGIVIFIIGFFVYTTNRKSSVNLIFSIFSLIIVVWLFCYSMMYFSKDAQKALLWARTGFLAIIFVPVLTYHFIIVFLNLKNRKFLYLIYLLSVPAILFSYSNYIYSGIRLHFWGYYPTAGKFYALFLSMFVITFSRGLWLLFVDYRKEKGIRREQIKYVTLGFLIGAFGSIDYLIKYPPFYNIYPFGYICAFVFYSIITYSILKYRLMDINIVLTRAGIFAFVYLLVLGVPFWMGYRILGNGLWIIPVSIMAVFASIGPFLYGYIRRRAEDIILREQRRYQSTLRQLSTTLTLIKDLDRLLKILIYKVSKTVKVEFACIYIKHNNHGGFIQKFPYIKCGFVPAIAKEFAADSETTIYIKAKHKPIFLEELNQNIRAGLNLRNGLIIPCFVRGKLLGFLLLGPKASGAIYTQADVYAFEILANQTALAIENTEFIEESQRTQAQLFAAERMASMGAMAGGMSHQINNRFHAIAMATSDTMDTMNFLHPDTYPQEAKDYFAQVKYALNRIQDNAKHGGKIVNDFLNFSQPARMQRESKEFHLSEPLDRAIEMVRIKTTFPEDTISIKIKESLPRIEGDFVLIQDVFFNLLDNALDAIKTKGESLKKEYKGSIEINMKQQGEKVEIKIKDNGTGMTDESQKKVFVPFFTTKATANKGTGLGLFVIQKIVHAHQGEINLSSVYAEGTTFAITLPIAQRRER